MATYRSYHDPYFHQRKIGRYADMIMQAVMARKEKNEHKKLALVEEARWLLSKSGDINDPNVQRVLANLPDKERGEIRRAWEVIGPDIQRDLELERKKREAALASYDAGDRFRQSLGVAKKTSDLFRNAQEERMPGTDLPPPPSYEQLAQQAATMLSPQQYSLAAAQKLPGLPQPTTPLSPQELIRGAPPAVRGLAATEMFPEAFPERVRKAARISARVEDSPYQKYLQEHRKKSQTLQEASLALRKRQQDYRERKGGTAGGTDGGPEPLTPPTASDARQMISAYEDAVVEEYGTYGVQKLSPGKRAAIIQKIRQGSPDIDAEIDVALFSNPRFAKAIEKQAARLGRPAYFVKGQIAERTRELKQEGMTHAQARAVALRETLDLLLEEPTSGAGEL